MLHTLFDFTLVDWAGALFALIPALLNFYMVYQVLRFIPKTNLSVAFVLFTISLICWQLDDACVRLAATAETATLWDSILSQGWIFIGPLALQFVLFYTGRKRIAASTLFNILLYASALFLAAWYHLETAQRVYVHSAIWGWLNDPSRTAAGRTIIYYFSLMMLLTLAILIQYTFRKRNRYLINYQSLLITIGFAIPILQGITTEGILPLFNLNEPLPITTTVMSTISLATFIALNRFRLFKISESISLKNLSEATTDFVFTISPEKTIAFVNDYLKKVFGIKGEQDDEVSIEILFNDHKQDLKRFEEEVLVKILQHEPVTNFQINFTLPSGKTVPVMLSANPVYNNNVLLGAFVVARDISEWKKVQETLESSERRFRALIEKSHDGVALTSANGTILFISHSIFEIAGYRPAELVGKKIFQFVHPDDLKAIREKFESTTMTPGAIVDYEFRYIHKNGSPIWIEGSRTNWLHDPSVQAIVSNFRNVTDRRMVESALEGQNDELRKINSELDQLVYCVSHDLRAPLMSMLGLINAFREELQDESANASQYMNYMVQSIERMDNIIRDILDYSRNTRQEAEPEAIPLNTFLHEIIDNLRYMDKASAMEFRITVPDDVIVYSDRFRLKIVFSNIVSNAIKYSSESIKKPFLNIDYARNGQSHVLRFSDNGIGIESKHVNKVFDMFYRATTSNMGSGLGLYLVRESVNRLKGKVEVTSQAGQGTTFTVYLPAVPAITPSIYADAKA